MSGDTCGCGHSTITPCGAEEKEYTPSPGASYPGILAVGPNELGLKAAILDALYAKYGEHVANAERTTHNTRMAYHDKADGVDGDTNHRRNNRDMSDDTSPLTEHPNLNEVRKYVAYRIQQDQGTLGRIEAALAEKTGHGPNPSGLKCICGWPGMTCGCASDKRAAVLAHVHKAWEETK